MRHTERKEVNTVTPEEEREMYEREVREQNGVPPKK